MSESQTTIVTGASGGIGGALAKAFLREGHNVVLSGRDEGKLEALVESFGARERCAVVVGDLLDQTTPHRIVETAVDKFGPTLRNLINNAGTFLVKPFLETDVADLRPFLDMFQNTYLLTRLTAKQISDQFGAARYGGEVRGNVIFISTVLTQGFIERFPCSAVGSVKSAYSGFARNACFELGALGIRVNTLDLGVVETPIYGLGEEALKSLRALQPLKTNGTPVEIADMTVFLTERAPFVTGQVMTMDGGVTAGHYAP